MRFAYLDESGIGNAKAEPFVVVAGIIVHADRQIKAIEQYLRDMIYTYVNSHLRKFTTFHAKELFRGGKTFTRTAYSDELRWKILHEICEIPRRFDLPVVMGCVPREQYKIAQHRSHWKDSALTAGAQSLASICCLIAIEKYMREVDDIEVAATIYENNDNAKRSIKDAQRMLRDSDFAKYLVSDLAWGAPYLPLSRIVETPLFSEKHECSILQVADAVAWTINRKLRNAPECDRFFEPIDKQLIIRARAFESGKHTA